MSPLLAAVLVAGIVVLAASLGLVRRRRDGRVRAGRGEQVRPGELGIAAARFGRDATLVQFRTDFCARCPAAHRLLATLADAREGVEVVEVDLTHRPDLSSRFRILQTPTTLLVDASGSVRARIAGLPERAHVEAALTGVVGRERTSHV